MLHAAGLAEYQRKIQFPVDVGGDALYTYQDLTRAGQSNDARFDFIRKAVEEHTGTARYKMAVTAEKYYAKHNETIEKYQKFLYTITGQAVPDLYSPNHKIKTLFFRRFVIQQVQYVLSNGVFFEGKDTKRKLGRGFDSAIVKLAKKAMVDSVSFGFWNLNHLEVFCFADTSKDPGFAPLYDESTGSLRAGVRYWMPSENVHRYTLYEEDGYTEFIQKDKEPGKVLGEKRGYLRVTVKAPADTVGTITHQNYGRLPIFAMYANDLQESELEGIREGIDCYDLIKSGFANDVDEASSFYWILKNSGGMDDVESLKKFVEQMKLHHAAVVDSDAGQAAEANTLDVPTQAREKALAIIKNDLYEDFQILNTSALAAGSKTATEIRTAYQPMDDKCGDFEFLIIDFIEQLLDLLGVQDTPSFRWNRIANQTEETEMVMTAYALLGDELALKKLPFITPEEAEARIKEITAEDTARLNNPPAQE